MGNRPTELVHVSCDYPRCGNVRNGITVHWDYMSPEAIEATLTRMLSNHLRQFDPVDIAELDDYNQTMRTAWIFSPASGTTICPIHHN